ncbi:MAG: TonB-dependent receptor domain-containing protein, partial [Luminiphilus sp.]
SDDWSAQFTWDNYNDNTRLVDQINITSIPYNGFGFFGPGYQDVTSGDLSAATDYSTTYSGGKFYSTIQGNNYALTLNGSVGNHDLKFITSKMETKERMDICSWGAPITPEYAASNFVLFNFGTGTADNPSNLPCFFPVLREQEFEQATSEFTVTSNFDGPLNYVAGLYYMTSDAPFQSGPVQVIESLQELEARAIYGELIWNITDNWGLTAGARYTDEEKDFSVTAGAFPNGQDFFFEDDELTYRLVLERKFDFGMIYASYSTGFRSGGFNSRGTTPNTVGPYESETVDTIELGLRSQFLNDRVTLNLTYFDSTYEDKQEAVVTAGDGSFIYNGQPEDCGGPTCTFIFNAGEVDNSGIEIEAMALVTEGLTLRAA